MEPLLPAFTAEGVLPPGDYALTLDGLCQSALVAGEHHENWDAQWRQKLVDNLAILIEQLWQVGIERIFINGSFVEEKSHPNDIDGYFECERAKLSDGTLQQQLNLLDPHKVWTWSPESRRSYHGYPKAQLPMWHQYRVELYPHWGQICGIRDEHGHDLQFPAAFRKSRIQGIAKGIVQIVR
jgi:hypothetical protein